MKFFNLANATIANWVPYSTLFLVLAFVVINTMLKRTVFGRHMYAVGGNSSTAIYSGIDVKNIRLIVYTISGLLAAIAGVLTASRVYSGQPTTGVGFEGEAIASSVLGGVSFTGGIGTLSVR
jgi:ribose transport system permease protein